MSGWKDWRPWPSGSARHFGGAWRWIGAFELPRPLRVAVLAVAGIGLAVVLFRFILRRAFVRLSDGNMATLLERQFPQFNDSLLTSVLLCGGEEAGYSLRGSGSGEQGARNDPASTDLSPGSQLPAPRFEMLARTARVAQQGLAACALSQVFNPMPLVRKAVIALGLAAAVGLLAVVNSARAQSMGRAESAPVQRDMAAQDPPGGRGLYG